PQRLLYERTIQGQGVDLVVVKPAAKPSPGTLRVPGAAHHIRSPCRQVYPTRVDETHHHPSQGLEVALIHPRGMLAQDKDQRLIQMRCVLHGDLPGKSVSQGSILTSHGERGERASLLSVNQQVIPSLRYGLPHRPDLPLGSSMLGSEPTGLVPHCPDAIFISL